MSTPQEWIEAVERRLGDKLSHLERTLVTDFVHERALGCVTDEDVFMIIDILPDRIDLLR